MGIICFKATDPQQHPKSLEIMNSTDSKTDDKAPSLQAIKSSLSIPLATTIGEKIQSQMGERKFYN
jgi:hypothetical protein